MCFQSHPWLVSSLFICSFLESTGFFCILELKVGHHIFSDGLLEHTRKLVILYPERSATNTNALYRVFCTGAVLWAKLYRRNYWWPMIRNIGRLHRSTDASNIPFIGEASNMRRKRDSSTLEFTEQSRSFQGERLPELAVSKIGHTPGTNLRGTV